MSGIRLHWFFLLSGWSMCQPATVLAGMPSVTFTEVASLRLEVISFFLVGLLLSAGAVHWIWYWLRRDFAWLPPLGYWRSLGVVTLWGLLFVVVLTMISGARELMTPGAWVKEGATYKLREPDAAEERQQEQAQIAARSMQLLSFSNALRQLAEKHEGTFPTAEEVKSEIDKPLRSLPDLPGTNYRYVAGATVTDRQRILAYEPQLYGNDVLAVTVGGELLQLPFEDLLTRVRKERASETTAAEVTP